MLEIPLTKDTDAEDVVWGLQTADALWKRGEKIDAIVWLRRAAQAAGDANDDDRALELARHAAELTEWMAGVSIIPDGNDDDLVEVHPIDDAAETEQTISAPVASWADAPAEAPPAAPRVQTQPMSEAGGGSDTAATGSAAPPPSANEGDEGRPSATSVPPAEKVHAGMFDPWADPSAPTAPIDSPTIKPAPPAHRSAPAPAVPTPFIAIADRPSEDEVVTSVGPNALSQLRSDAPPSPAISVPAPSMAPPRPSRPSPGKPPVPHAPKPPPPLPPRPPPPLPRRSPSAIAAEASTQAAPASDAPIASLPPEDPPAAPAPAASSPPMLDDIEAFADLPDDARTAFAAAATIHPLAEGDEITTFALAYIISGSFDVAATMVDAPAVRLVAGAVLRARGSTNEDVPMRLISTKGEGVVATWSAAAVEDAFRTCPWVEEDLRAAADRVQTAVGITIGPLGERLDVSIREEIIARLTLRALGPNEIVVSAGEPVPGLLIVGVGELELVIDGKVTGVVGCGGFLFPTEVLGAGPSPATARAGLGGALVMFGDRAIAQELLVTCPPLLEVFAGM